MAHHWDSGFMVRKPSWHRNERAVLLESPRSWDEARKEADLLWDVETEPVYTLNGTYTSDTLLGQDRYDPVEGYQALRRDDTHDLLAIQRTSYEVIRNERFGDVINAVLAIEDDEHVEFEALMSLYGGRAIVALCYFADPLVMPWDPSKNYTYCALNSRHDGNGGLRGIPTNVRVQCANTLNQAEMLDGRAVGFTIRHTSNWKERIAEVRADMVLARGQGKKWVEFSEQLALWKATPRRRDTFLTKMFPVSDDHGRRKNENALANREKVRTILQSESCADIADTGYGLLMATTEWSDHFRGTRTGDTYVARQLLQKEEPKARATRILRQQAGIRI